MKRLAALAAALLVAFVWAPGALASNASTSDLTGNDRIVAAFRGAFVTYWASGDRAFDPGMQRVVDYWFRYHVAKGVLAAALLVVFLALGVAIWRAFLRARGVRAAALATGGAVSTGLAVISLAAVLANIHGMAAPFGSLLPMLFGGAGGGPLAATLTATLAQVKQQQAAGHHPPALDMITSDYVKFHAVMAVEGSIVVVVLAGLTVLLWRRFTRASGQRRARQVLAAYGVFTPLLAATLLVVVLANAATAANPQPGLEGFLAGGW
jgi:hypothetical protein